MSLKARLRMVAASHMPITEDDRRRNLRAVIARAVTALDAGVDPRLVEEILSAYAVVAARTDEDPAPPAEA